MDQVVKTCKVCPEPHDAKGFCSKHYWRWRAYGDPFASGLPDLADPKVLQRKVMSRMTVEDRGYETPCWISNRSLKENGYTTLGHQGRTWYTHRFSYTVFVGPIPDGLEIDHLCRVRECCNPDHLEPVTCRINLLRGETLTAQETAQTHCKNGHSLSGDNLYLRPDGRIQRGCRACRIEATTRARQRREAQVGANGLPEGMSHGVAIAYISWGCRCDACREAARVYRARLAARHAS